MKGHSFLVAGVVVVAAAAVLVTGLLLSLNPAFVVTIITFLQLSWTTGRLTTAE